MAKIELNLNLGSSAYFRFSDCSKEAKVCVLLRTKRVTIHQRLLASTPLVYYYCCWPVSINSRNAKYTDKYFYLEVAEIVDDAGKSRFTTDGHRGVLNLFGECRYFCNHFKTDI